MASRIIEVFQNLEDPRKSNATRHDFVEMLTLAVIAVICGHKTCVDMEDFGKTHRDFLCTFLRLKYGIPSHDALSSLFRMLEPEAFEGSLLKLADMLNRHLPRSADRIDTDLLLEKFNQPPRKSIIYLLNVFGLCTEGIFKGLHSPEEQQGTATDMLISPYLQQFCIPAGGEA